MRLRLTQRETRRSSAARLTSLGVLVACFLAAGTAGGGTASTQWSGQWAVLPAGVEMWFMASVSCGSPDNCAAVGNDLDGKGLLVDEASGQWRPAIQPSPPPNATPLPNVGLTSVSCPSAGNCAAVGTYTDTASEQSQGLLLDEVSGQWGAGLEATLPANAGPVPEVSLYSVSCASAGNCAAVGSYWDDVGHQHGLLLNEVSGHWSAGVDAGQDTQVVAVSCPSAGNCTAVGGLGGMPLDWDENAGQWGVETAANLPPGGQGIPNAAIRAVSCASAGNCAAAGFYEDADGNIRGVILNEVSGQWGIGTEASLPADAQANPNVDLRSVSCPSAGNCTAVGWYSTASSGQEGVLLDEVSGQWRTGTEATLPADAPPLGTSEQVALRSVSCASAGNCSTVGDYGPCCGVRQDMFVDEVAGQWSQGTEASLPPDAFHASLQIVLSTVSCPAAGNCAAVGQYDSRDNVGNVTPEGLLVNSHGNLQSYTLSVSKAGTGSGTVTSSPAGISCGSICSHTYSSGTQVTLSAVASSGSTFTGWSGAGCSGTDSCVVTMNAAESVTASFSKPSTAHCVVPKVVGKTLAIAKTRIRHAHCRVGRITRKHSSARKKGRVIAQSPRAGKRLAIGARVNLVVGKG